MLEIRPELSVVVPAYNEAQRIKTTLNNLVTGDNLLFNRTCEVLVVMDGCTDETPQIVKQMIDQSRNVAALIFPERLGKGGAIMQALKHVKGEIIAYVDADGSVSPSELRKLIELAGKYDLVIGSRYLKNSKLEKNRSISRNLMSRSFNVISKLLFWHLRGIRDTQCGVKVFSKRLVDAIKNDFLITDFAFDVNLIYSSLSFGFSVKEAGICWVEKDGSKLSGGFLRHSFVMFFSLFRLRLYYSRYRKLLYFTGFEVLSRQFYCGRKIYISSF